MKGNFEKLQIEIFGESHADEIGVRLGGIPDGCELTLECAENLLSRRRSSAGIWSTKRTEADEPIIVSGLKKTENRYRVDGKIDIRIRNTNVRPSDYANTECVPRPSQADYAAYVKDGRISSGGGRFSGRMTAPLCIAGGIAQELLAGAGIRVCAYLATVGGVRGDSYKSNEQIANSGISEDDEKRIKNSDFPLLDESLRGAMQDCICAAAQDGDSVGGAVECIVSGIEAGAFGDAMFEGLEGKIAYAVYSIPAVKGVEFGSGFELANMRGSEVNDGYILKDGKVMTSSNRSGGINGGISNGMPLTLTAAFRPTPSIFKTQKSVNLADMSECDLNIKGRHDACIAVRAVPCVEAAVSLALLDEALKLRADIELYND